MFAKIPQHVLEDIKDRTSIVELVGQYVELKKAGANYMGLCPFHGENAPSFTVNEQKKFFHCFGCGANGNAFKFLMDIENMTFIEAVENLAGRAGIELPEYKKETSEDRAKRSERERLFEANLAAVEFFEAQMIEHKDAEIARDYLKKRGVSKEIGTLFRLGFAPDAWDTLVHWMQKKPFRERELEKLGLIKTGKKGGHYDFFRNRLMFPIIMQSGRVVGFSGRTLSHEENVGKYINTTNDSPIYDKSKSLYGFHAARLAIGRQDRAILVEGNLDVVKMHQYGFSETVAPLGTALTREQIRFIKRMTKNFYLLFDGDKAGEKAMFRSLDLLLAESVNAKAVLLDKGHDPDSFLDAEGKEALEALIADAKYLFDIWLEKQYSTMMDGVRGKTECMRSIIPMLAKIPDPVEEALYMEQISERLDLKGQTSLIRQELRRFKTEKNWNAESTRARLERAKTGPRTQYEAAEETIFSLLMNHTKLVAETIEKENLVNRIQTNEWRELANFALDAYRNEEIIDPIFLLEQIKEIEWKNRVVKILNNMYEADEQAIFRTLDDAVRILERADIEREIEEIRLEVAQTANDLKEKIRLFEKERRLRKELDELKRPKLQPNSTDDE